MQVNVAGLRRNIKNLAHNYSDAQVKVREATSNDPWGPSATIMAEIADLTYNVVAFSEIMQMIWKRLNDHGKNWRHVYKALILLEYLIKTGTEKVSQQCKENIYAIQTLREFVYFEEGKDQGTHVREKAKQLVILLKDDERLKNERAKALKAKERFAQHPSGFGSDGFIDGPLPRDLPPGWQEEPVKPVSDLELVRPQTAGEEELQLQLAMAMSREEAEQEEAKRRSDDVRLQLALSQSEQDFNEEKTSRHHSDSKEQPQSHLLDLLDISLGATSISNPPLGATSDPWGTPARAASQLSDPWTGTASPLADPWHPVAGSRNAMGITLANGGNNGISGAEGGTVTHAGDSWAGVRTQSPSITSGSSNEGWLQNQGINGIMPQQQQPQQTQLIGDLSKEDPWESKRMAAVPNAAAAKNSADPWISGVGSTLSASPAIPSGTDNSLIQADPWAPAIPGPSTAPWNNANNASAKKPSPDLDEFDVISNRNKNGTTNVNLNNNNASTLLDDLDPLSATNSTALTAMSSSYVTTNSDGVKKPLKDPQAFLGENSALVNLDNLIKPAVPYASPIGNSNAAAYNPFSDSAVIPPKTNLFQQPPVPSINQLKKQQPFTVTMNQDPWAPVSNINTQLNNSTDDARVCDVMHQKHSINNGSSFYPYPREYSTNSYMKMSYSKSDGDTFQSYAGYSNDVSSDPISNNNIDLNHLKNSENNNERLSQSFGNIRNVLLLPNDNAIKGSYQNSQFLHSSLYPNVKVIHNDITADNILQEDTTTSNLSSLHAPLAYFTNHNNNTTINTYNQSLGPSNIASISTSIQSPFLSTTTPVAKAKTAAATISGSSAMAETTFQSRSAAFINPNPFASNYFNELQASLATTPGVTVKPLLETNEATNQMNFNEFFYDCNDNTNMISTLTNANTTTTTNERKLEQTMEAWTLK